MKKVSISLVLMSIVATTSAQYYYKDIISNKQLLLDMKSYKQNNIKKIVVKSFEENGEESQGFFCEKKLSNNYKTAKVFTRSDFTSASAFTSNFDEGGKLLNTYDSSDLSITEIWYTYNSNNQISSILSSIRSKDEDFVNGITEEHIYTYENELPVKMIRVKNNTDTIPILFSKDNNGNISIEKDTKSGTKYYYYYDTKNRLTDIVPATEFSNNLKPDYIFEYNNTGLVSQMTAVEEGSSNYFIWKYTYDNGLRVKERCYSNEKRLMGSIGYEYK